MKVENDSKIQKFQANISKSCFSELLFEKASDSTRSCESILLLTANVDEVL